MSLISRIFDKPNDKGSAVTISGEARGKVISIDDVVITSTGYCESNIKAERLEIAGVVKGNIEVDDLIIREAGQLSYGKISYKNLILDDGGVMSLSPNKVVDLKTFTSSNVLPDNEALANKVKEPRFYSNY